MTQGRSTFKLRLSSLWVHHVAGVHYQVYAPDPYLPLIVALDFHDCSSTCASLGSPAPAGDCRVALYQRAYRLYKA